MALQNLLDSQRNFYIHTHVSHLQIKTHKFLTFQAVYMLLKEYDLSESLNLTGQSRDHYHAPGFICFSH